MEKSPPAYSSLDEGSSRMSPRTAHETRLNRFLIYLTDQANDRYAIDAEYPPEIQAVLRRETERIRNMLIFTLSIDYQGYPLVTMSAADLEHFLHMAEALRQLRTTGALDRPGDRPGRNTGPTPEERQALAAYFYKYLHQPCKVLSIPLDCAYSQISYLSRYMGRQGAYKGSIEGILEQHGVIQLGTKLWLDREILIPRIFSDDISTQRQLLRAVRTIQNRFFVWLGASEFSIKTNPMSGGQSVRGRIKFELTDLGKTYTKGRNAAIARGLKDKSTQHWKMALGKCVERITAKIKPGQGRRWKLGFAASHTESPPFPRRAETELDDNGWMKLLSFRAPDYCDFQDSENVSK